MIQPLRNLMLIEVEDSVKEENRPSGLVVFTSSLNLYGWDEEHLAADIIQKKKQNIGNVVASGNRCTFFGEGDRVIYRKMTEVKKLIYDNRDCVLVSEDDILCKVEEGKMICNPDHLIVKIKKEDREALFTKKIKRYDGTTVDLFMYNPTPSDDVNHNAKFVSTGEIVSVGANIKDVHVGDIAILDYLVDNDNSIVIGYDDSDKLISVLAVTRFSKMDEWVYANRRTDEDRTKKSFGHRLCVHDIKIASRGDYETMTQVYGFIHDDKLFSIHPFVFLEHENNVIQKVSPSGILFSESQKIFERKVLSVSNETKEMMSMDEGVNVIVDDYDVFDISFNGKTIHAINDIDVISIKE